MCQIDQTGYCIIIVDDNKDSLMYYKSVLQSQVYKCHIKTFTSINDKFFNYIRDPHIDLFIIDIHLGEQSGFDLTNELLKTMKGLTFLFISGYDYTLDSFKEFDGKCIYDYLSKPIKPLEFAIRVKALLNVSKSYNRVIRYLELMRDECHELSVDNLRNQYFEKIRQDQLMIEKIKKEFLI